MASKPPRIVVPGLSRGKGIPSGYILGRSDSGRGPVQLIKGAQAARLGLVSQAQLQAAVPAIPDGDVLANTSGAAAQAVGTGVSALLDYVFSNGEGSILYRDAAVWKALAPGSMGNVLTMGAALPAWNAPAGAVTSVFGRTGAVTAQTGDYTAAQVTNAAATNVANTFTVSPQTIAAPSGGNSLSITSNGAASVSLQRFQANANSPQFQSTKGRGTVASPAAVVVNDQIFNFQSIAQASSSVTVICAGLMTKVIEPTPSTTAMGAQWLMSMCPAGSVTLTTFLTADWTTGLVINGTTIVNASGVLQVPATAVTPGSYNSANITVGADGRITSAASGAGGGGGVQHGFEGFGGLPLSSAFTAINVQSTALTNAATALVLQTPAVGGQPSTFYQEAAPGSTPWNVYMRAEAVIFAGRFGLGVRATATGKVTNIGINAAEIGVFRETVNNAGSSFSATEFAVQYAAHTPRWFRVNNDGTNLTFYVSFDGITWMQIYTETIAAWVGSADNIGFLFVPQSGGGNNGLWVSSFGTTTPV